MSDLSLSIYQNHPLDALVDVAMHYVTLKEDGTFALVSDTDSANAVFSSCKDLTNTRRWLTIEMHLKDIDVHGCLTIFERKSKNSYTLPSKDNIIKRLKAFIDSTKEENETLFGS